MLNLLEIDNLVDAFLLDNLKGIKTIHTVHYYLADELSFKSFLSEIKEILKNGCVTFLNKNSTLEGINNYLFYIVNDYAKKHGKTKPKVKIEYICPGCDYDGHKEILLKNNFMFFCRRCKDKISLNDPKKLLYQCFAKHNKSGFRCKDCKKFIPESISKDIICPYPNCCFTGNIDQLKKMHHPSIISKMEYLILDKNISTNLSIKDTIFDVNALKADNILSIKQDLNKKISTLKEVIDSQNNNVPYNSSQFTVKHKNIIYQSISNILNMYPEEMVDYLLNCSRSGGFQNKIFKEYIKLLESNLPFSFKKNNKLYVIDNLMHEELNIFSGISFFDTIVTNNYIKNNTQEFYIGGRKGSISRAYYIGKLINVFDKDSKKSLLENVVDYSFSGIDVRNIADNTNVVVAHLRVPPHYQMGSMAHINRIRKKIVDKTQFILNKMKNE